MGSARKITVEMPADLLRRAQRSTGEGSIDRRRPREGLLDGHRE
jgi:hypothetical protein